MFSIYLSKHKIYWICKWCFIKGSKFRTLNYYYMMVMQLKNICLKYVEVLFSGYCGIVFSSPYPTTLCSSLLMITGQIGPENFTTKDNTNCQNPRVFYLLHCFQSSLMDWKLVGSDDGQIKVGLIISTTFSTVCSFYYH